MIVRTEPNRPQPNIDRDAENGMATTVGRVRECALGTKFVLLGHNTIRGAARASILNAELFKVADFLPVRNGFRSIRSKNCGFEPYALHAIHPAVERSPDRSSDTTT